MGIITAIISGALMSLQGVFNEGVTKQTSIWISASFVQLTAFLVCILAWLFTGRDGNFASLFSIHNKYMLLGGVMGIVLGIMIFTFITTPFIPLSVTKRFEPLPIIKGLILFELQKSIICLRQSTELGITSTLALPPHLKLVYFFIGASLITVAPHFSANNAISLYTQIPSLNQ